MGMAVGVGDAHATAPSVSSAPAAKTRSRKTMIALIGGPPSTRSVQSRQALVGPAPLSVGSICHPILPKRAGLIRRS